MAKENLFTRRAAACATVLNCMLKALAVVKEQMRTDHETTAPKLVKMVNTAGDKMFKSTTFLAQRTPSHHSVLSSYLSVGSPAMAVPFVKE